MPRAKTLFVTGTDTGVGKTLFTALLLRHLREAGRHALAMKPFCSGGLEDVKLLQSLQPGELSDREMNPYYFSEPVAPLIAREARRKRIRLSEVVAHIRAVQARCDTLLIEGSGGLLVPLGRGFTVADLIRRIDCEVVIVARNQLGTINHTLLTVNALQAIDIKPLAIMLMAQAEPDIAAANNQKVLAQLLKVIDTFCIPFLGSRPFAVPRSKKTARAVKKILVELANSI